MSYKFINVYLIQNKFILGDAGIDSGPASLLQVNDSLHQIEDNPPDDQSIPPPMQDVDPAILKAIDPHGM